MTLVDIGAVFGWIGVVSFGGGLAVVPEMSRQLVTNRSRRHRPSYCRDTLRCRAG